MVSIYQPIECQLNTKLDRLKELRKVIGGSQLDFAKRWGIHQTSMSKIENGKVPVGNNLAKALYINFNVNPAWWETGEGEMFAKGNTVVTNSHNNFSNHSGSNNRLNIGGENNSQVPGEDSISLQNQVDQLRQALAEKDAALLAAKDEIIDLLKKANNK